jgi:hypothetical protein
MQCVKIEWEEWTKGGNKRKEKILVNNMETARIWEKDIGKKKNLVGEIKISEATV